MWYGNGGKCAQGRVRKVERRSQQRKANPVVTRMRDLPVTFVTLDSKIFHGFKTQGATVCELARAAEGR